MGNKRTASAKEPQFFKGIDNTEALSRLEHAAAQAGIEVRYEKGDFRSAGCRLEDKRLVILQKTDSDAAKIETLLQELAALDLSSFDLPIPILSRISAIRQHVDEPSLVEKEP
ncbi:MAG: hypothetical protein ONB12_00560 [candidate division KSB1 bacterium]|nr:hypothetical protein [candidate division KSB1 bacterium]